MQRRLICITTILSIFLSIIGCTTSLKDYEPKSPDEEAIVSVLIKYGKARSSGDVQGCLALWHDEAKIMYGGSRRLATKAEYQSILQDQMTQFPRLAFTELRVIDVSGKVAKVETGLTVATSGDSWNSICTVNLVKENNQWLMMSWKWR